MTLPIAISVPHSGTTVPPEVEDRCLLTREDLIKDSDEGALEIYSPLASTSLTSQVAIVARSVADLSRAPDDTSDDGVVKTYSNHLKQVFREPPSPELVNSLIEKYWRPYHEALSRFPGFQKNGAILAVDCHTMGVSRTPASKGPPLKLPAICLSNADGTCPAEWIEALAIDFKDAFNAKVSINDPFPGGYIIRSHSKETAWVQVELSREPFATLEEKGERVLAAFTAWCKRGFS